MAAPPSRVKVKLSRKRQLLYWCIFTAILFIAIELVLWIGFALPAPYLNQRYHYFLPSWNWGRSEPPFTFDFHGGPLVGVEPGTREIAVNSYGFLYPETQRTRSQDNELRIALIGGSTVECMALKPEMRVSHQLQHILSRAHNRPATVLNLGLSGHDSRHHIATMAQHVTALDVDCAVFLVGGNDSATRDMVDAMLDESCFGARRRDSSITWWLSHTQMGRHTRLWIKQLRSTRPATEPYFTSHQRHVREAPVLSEPLGQSQLALDTFARNIRSLAGICRAHDIPALFVSQPFLFKDEMRPEEEAVSWMRGTRLNGKRYQLTSRQAARLIDDFNQQLLKTCAEENIPVLHAEPLVEKSIRFFYDDVHYNNRGAERVAQLISDSLQHYDLLTQHSEFDGGLD